MQVPIYFCHDPTPLIYKDYMYRNLKVDNNSKTKCNYTAV